jgi:acetyl-CoA synthetase
LLLSLRDDLESARRSFRWPDVDCFNWTLDWFDAELAQGARADAPALIIVGENAASVSFAELSRRSNCLANGLRAQGLRRGDVILLMLDNRTALWETMLAAMKLGALVTPATTLLTREDLASRLNISRARLWITSDDLARKFDSATTTADRIVVGEHVTGWMPFEDLFGHSENFVPDRQTSADDPILLYFTSGTTARPKLVIHSHRSYGIGSLSTMYWLGLRPEDRHLNVSSPGWAKHAWSCFFAPWNAGATVFIPNYGRFDARTLLDALTQHRVTSLCAPPTVWRMLIQEDLTQWQTSLETVCGAGEPLNIEVVERAWGLSIRDGYGQTETTAQIANTPGQAVRPGSVGRALPGYEAVLLDADDNEDDEGQIALRLKDRPAGLVRVPARRWRRRSSARRLLLHW